MNLFKKILAVSIALIILSAMSVTVFGSIDANEKAVLDFLEQEFTVGNQKVKLPVEYITQAENHFKLGTVSITAADKDTIISKLEEAMNEIQGNGAASVADGQFLFDVEKLPANVRDSVMKLVEEAAAVLDLKVALDGKSLKVTDSAGKVTVFNPDINKVPVTGELNESSITGMLLVTGSVVVLLAAAAVIFVKTRKSALESA